MKKRKSTIILLITILSVQLIQAQSMDCKSILKYRMVSYPFESSDLSKSAICTSGKTYEFVTTLDSANEYRFSFFASSVFNHKINFKLIDIETNKLILELKGDLDEDAIGTCALRSYFSDKQNKLVHPHFDLFPKKSMKIKIIVEIPSVNAYVQNSSIYHGTESEIQGCVSVFIQDKKVNDLGFQ